MILSRLSETIPGSQILHISNEIKKRKLAGELIYNFTVGDFDPQEFPIPKILEEEIISAYQNKFTNYPAAEGNADLREAIVYFFREFQGIESTPDNILVSAGGRPLIYALYRAIIDPGDKVIYPVPSWNNHYYTMLVGGVAVEIQTGAENHFMPTAKQIAPHVKEASLLALCSPQNPTGTSFKSSELKEICELVLAENHRRGDKEKKLYILFDQMYWLLSFGQKHCIDPITVCPAIKPYVIYVDAISKSFAATGLRVGWALGPAALLGKMKAILTHIGAWAPMAEQKAVAKFLLNEKAVNEFLQGFKKEIEQRLLMIYHGFMKLKEQGYPVDAIEPGAAIYLAVKIDIPEAHVLLLNDAGIGVLPFSVFGCSVDSRWYRISVGTCKIEDIKPMLKKLKEVLCPVTKV